jgi:hypothetical protein
LWRRASIAVRWRSHERDGADRCRAHLRAEPVCVVSGSGMPRPGGPSPAIPRVGSRRVAQLQALLTRCHRGAATRAVTSPTSGQAAG